MERSNLLRCTFRLGKPWRSQTFSPEGLVVLAPLMGYVVTWFVAGAVGHFVGLAAGVVAALVVMGIVVGIALWAAPFRQNPKLEVGSDGIHIKSLGNRFLPWWAISEVVHEGDILRLKTRSKALTLRADCEDTAAQLAALLSTFAETARTQAMMRRQLPQGVSSEAFDQYRQPSAPGDQDWLATLSDGRLPLCERCEAAKALGKSADPITRERARVRLSASASPKVRWKLLRALRQGTGVRSNKSHL